jgi:hypothetical protein
MFLVIKIHNIVVTTDTEHSDGIQMIVLGGYCQVFEAEISVTITIYEEHSF